jgi:uncharacterized RDD family membrane protein YckC
MSAINPYQPPSATIGPEAQQPDQAVRLAGAGKRFVGSVIDGLALLICTILTMAATVSLWSNLAFDSGYDGDSLVASLVALACMTVPLSIEAWLIVTRGKSLGKLFLKMRIVRARDQGPVGFVHGVLLRRWLFILVGAIPILGVLIGLADALAIFRASTRCLHDDLAGTIVIDEQPEPQNLWRAN